MEEEEDKGEGDKIVAVKLLRPLGENGEGDVIHVPEAVGEALCTAGVAEHATEDDMSGGAEEVEEETEQPMLANSIDRLTNKIEKGVAKAFKAGVDAAKKTSVGHLPIRVAIPPQPEYKSLGHAIKDYARLWVKANIRGEHIRADSAEANRVMSYQEKAAANWNAMGIQCKAPLGINETTNAQGGFLVNTQFSPDVYSIPHTQLDLSSLCESVDAKSLTYSQRYVNESSLANGSIYGGLNMTAVAEGASFTSSLPAWANLSFTLQKLAYFVYYTSEILEDASYPVESEVNEYVNKAFLYGINSQIIQGTTIEGALNASSLVTVTKSSNDTAFASTPATNLTYADITNIWAQVYPDCKASPKGVWLFHPSLEMPLTNMAFTFGGATPAYGLQYSVENGPQGIAELPTTPLRLFSKPAYPSWACSAPGAAGDIMYVDFGTFLHYRRPLRVEISRDVQFTTDQIAMRFVWRGDIKTRFRNKVTGPTGSQQFSAIVTRSAAGT